MKANIKKIRKHRRFTDDFKKSIVAEFESGKLSVPELSRLHGIATYNIYQWIYKFSTFNTRGYRIIEMKQSSSKKVKDLELRIKELEQMVGQKQIKIDFYEKMMEIAKKELNIDIKKNFSTQQSGSSGKIKKG